MLHTHKHIFSPFPIQRAFSINNITTGSSYSTKNNLKTNQFLSFPKKERERMKRYSLSRQKNEVSTLNAGGKFTEGSNVFFGSQDNQNNN